MIVVALGSVIIAALGASVALLLVSHNHPTNVGRLTLAILIAVASGVVLSFALEQL